MSIIEATPNPDESCTLGKREPVLSSSKLELSSIANILSSYRYRYGNEIQLQDGMQSVLEAAGHCIERERVLDSKSRLDLWADGIVVEVKVDGSLGAALRQVSRYMKHPDVRGVVLASTERWARQPLSELPEWGGKPFMMIQVLRQSL